MLTNLKTMSLKRMKTRTKRMTSLKRKMTMTTTKRLKPRQHKKNRNEIQLTHRHFGAGEVLHKITTDAGDGLLVKFADKRRIILVDSPGWANPDDAEGAFEAAAEEPKLKEKLQPIRVRAA